MPNLDSIHKALHAAVKTRLDIVSDHAFRDRNATAHLDALKSAASQLDTLITQLPPDTDPALRHYLERQSYMKALAWLEEQGI
jgi:flagellar biosynthesis chaperone FliJ